MKTKKLAFDNLSTQQCSHEGCTKFIKQRLINLSDRFTKCYKHYCEDEAKRDHTINTRNREVRLLAGLPVKRFV